MSCFQGCGPGILPGADKWPSLRQIQPGTSDVSCRLVFFSPIDSKQEFSVLENFIQHYVNLGPVEPMVELVTLEQLWIQILIPPLSSIMILGTLLHLSEL